MTERTPEQKAQWEADKAAARTMLVEGYHANNHWHAKKPKLLNAAGQAQALALLAGFSTALEHCGRGGMQGLVFLASVRGAFDAMGITPADLEA